MDMGPTNSEAGARRNASRRRSPVTNGSDETANEVACVVTRQDMRQRAVVKVGSAIKGLGTVRPAIASRAGRVNARTTSRSRAASGRTAQRTAP